MVEGLGVHRRAAIPLELKKTREEAAALLLLPPPGNSERTLSHPGQAFRGASPARPGHRAFSLGTRMEEAQERPLPVSGGAGAAPPPKTTAPASWRLTLPWASPGAGWWVAGGATGRTNCAC
jgi:hypothetical protein